MSLLHVRIAVYGLIGLFLLAFFFAVMDNPLLREVDELYCSQYCSLLTEVKSWVKQFGPAQQLQDEIFNNFIYWPREGIAVLASPLYEAQGRRIKNRASRLVTSIFVPCRKTLPAGAFSIYIDASLTFSSTPLEKFPDSKLAKACRGEYRSLFLFSGRLDSDEIWLSNMPFYLFGRSAAIVHFDQGQPATIEIIESNIFSWYD